MLYRESLHCLSSLWSPGQLWSVFTCTPEVSHVSTGNQRNRPGQVQLIRINQRMEILFGSCDFFSKCNCVWIYNINGGCKIQLIIILKFHANFNKLHSLKSFFFSNFISKHLIYMHNNNEH